MLITIGFSRYIYSNPIFKKTVLQAPKSYIHTRNITSMAYKQYTETNKKDLNKRGVTSANDPTFTKRPRILLRKGDDSEVSFSENDTDYETAERIIEKQKTRRNKRKENLKRSSPIKSSFENFTQETPQPSELKAASRRNSMVSNSSDFDIIESFSKKMANLDQFNKKLSSTLNSFNEKIHEPGNPVTSSKPVENQGTKNKFNNASKYDDCPLDIEADEFISCHSSEHEHESENDQDLSKSFQDILSDPSLLLTHEQERPQIPSHVTKDEQNTGAANKSPVDLQEQKLSNNSIRASVLKNLKDGLKKSSFSSAENSKMTFLTQRQNTVELLSRESSEIPQLHKDTKAPQIKTVSTLSGEQNKVIELAKLGASMFYTGAAGTGKSVLLRAMIKELKYKFDPGEIVVTASTGLAACNIGGITLHSFAGVGLGNDTADKLLSKVKRSKVSRERWALAKVLIIDEISMIDCELLDKLDYIAKSIKKSVKPFGGIQLIFCGDFFQLPPVVKNYNQGVPLFPTNPLEASNSNSYESMNHHFAFNAKVWKEAIKCTIVLQKVFRQKGDLKFVEMLNEIRLGKVSWETQEEFEKLSRELKLDDSIVPTQLYPTRREVEVSNNERLEKLNGQVTEFIATEGGSLKDEKQRKKILDNFLAVDVLKLKPGAQVMMIKNMDPSLVNGSLGKVICFMSREDYTIRLAHDNDDSESDSVFDFMTKNSDDAKVNDYQDNINRKIQIHKDLKRVDRKVLLPLVKFFSSDGSTRSVLVEPEEWKYENEQQQPLVTKQQLPLILAWSLSIHKSQGLTLPYCKVDLSKIFEKGQAYVALSRAVSRAGLQVLNFKKEKVFSHQKVIEFYSGLSTVNEAVAEYMESRKNVRHTPDETKPTRGARKRNKNKLSNENLDHLQPSIDAFSRVKTKNFNPEDIFTKEKEQDQKQDTPETLEAEAQPLIMKNDEDFLGRSDFRL